jgi:hypothetical protein
MIALIKEPAKVMLFAESDIVGNKVVINTIDNKLNGNTILSV